MRQEEAGAKLRGGGAWRHGQGARGTAQPPLPPSPHSALERSGHLPDVRLLQLAHWALRTPSLDLPGSAGHVHIPWSVAPYVYAPNVKLCPLARVWLSALAVVHLSP